jgi:hypothetical protein
MSCSVTVTPAMLNILSAKQGRERMRFGAVAGPDAVAHGDRQADGGHHDGHHAVLEQRVDHTALEHPAQQEHRHQHAARKASQQRQPGGHEGPIMMKAGSITNSPCAKLMVPLACHSSVKPRRPAHRWLPVAKPLKNSWRKSVMEASPSVRTASIGGATGVAELPRPEPDRGPGSELLLAQRGQGVHHDCCPFFTSTRKLSRSMSPLSSKLTSISTPGCCFTLKLALHGLRPPPCGPACRPSRWRP